MLVVFSVDTSNRKRAEVIFGSLATLLGRHAIKHDGNRALVVTDIDTSNQDRAATMLCDLTDLMMPEIVRDIREHNLPPLYKSGIRYARQNPQACAFRYPSDVFARRNGDCKQLVWYRMGELQLSGEKCTPRVLWLNNKKGLSAHMQLRRADGTIKGRKGNGTIEDPSISLGMSAKGVPT